MEHNADFCNLDFCVVTSCGHLINVTAPSKTFGVRNREEPFNFQISNVTTKSHRENTKSPDPQLMTILSFQRGENVKD